MKILYICQWNIGRSQIAESLTNNITKHVAISAWIDDVWHKYNFSPYFPAINMLKDQFGIDMSKQNVKQITKNMLDGVDKIILLCSQKECRNVIPEYILWFDPMIKNYITDPNWTEDKKLKEIVKDIHKFIINNI